MSKPEISSLASAFVVMLGGWRPLVDITECENKLLIKIEVPGVDSASINVKVEGYKLWVEGRKDPPVARKLLLAEREYGNFFLQINLPDDVIPQSAHAVLKNGLLEISFEKSKRSFTLKIEGGEDDE